MKDMPFKEIGDRLLWHRNLVGMTQSEYAAAIGVVRNSYTSWETGAQRLSLNGARAIKKRFGISLDWLIDGDADTLPMTVRNAWLSRP